MKNILLESFGPIISDKLVGDEIKSIILECLKTSEIVVVDMNGVKSMATFNAKQIFGSIYISLTPKVFFRRIKIINASDDIKYIIKIGIQSALDDVKSNGSINI